MSLSASSKTTLLDQTQDIAKNSPKLKEERWRNWIDQDPASKNNNLEMPVSRNNNFEMFETGTVESLISGEQKIRMNLGMSRNQKIGQHSS